VPLPTFLDLLCVFLVSHNLVKMNLVVKEIVISQTLEWLQHLLDVLLEGLDQQLILNLDVLF
jgi:hypothetical protein